MSSSGAVPPRSAVPRPLRHLHQPSQDIVPLLESSGSASPAPRHTGSGDWSTRMSALKSHRIVIASLFLPVVVDLTGNSNNRNESQSQFQLKASSSSRTIKLPPPIASVIDDLGVKIHAPQTPPPTDRQNPFLSLSQSLISAEPDSYDVTPTPASVFSVPTLARPSHSQRLGGHHDSARPPPRHLSRRASRSSSLARGAVGTSTPPRNEFAFIPNPHGNGGLYNAVSSVNAKLTSGKLWIGVLGQLTDHFGTELRRGAQRRLMDEEDCRVVWAGDEDFGQSYDVFCHQVLWPCLHYAVPDAPKTKTFYESASFAQYKAVNQKFADAIVDEYEEGDIIWVNDYHLMLVPQMVRAKLPGAVIGFFLHVAFPSSEIFRCLANRTELLKGMLGADLIGFQTANFLRHFRQTVSRILSVETLPKGIQLDELFVDIGVFPMGIDVKALSVKRKDSLVREACTLLRERYAGMKLVVGRDKLDEIQGVRQKLQAFEFFLDNYPEFRGKAILIQVALSTSEESESHSSVSDLVSRINSRYSTLTYQPIVFLHTQDLTFDQYLALLTVADVFLVTSLREGMALRTHEFVECQTGRSRPLVLSEFAGSHSFSGFRSCISINPWDKRQTADAIHQALTMSDDEATSRWQDLHSHVVAQTAQAFVSSFLNRCLRVHSEHQHSDVASIPPFPISVIIPRYRYSSGRLILLDYEDTLWSREVDALGRNHEPPADALKVLADLVKDSRNQVWVLSGLPIKGALDKVAAAVPKLGLCAENGCFIKPRGSTEWINMVANFNLTWKAPCMELLNYFMERTPGSFIEERAASIVFRYIPHGTPLEGATWARRQAAEAQNHIWDSLGERYGLRIIPGQTSFLVLPNNISRSSAVGAILHPGGPAAANSRPSIFLDDEPNDQESEIDFVLAIGGDQKLLSRLNDLDNSETVTTSWKSSDAKWRLNKEKVLETLQEFAKAK